MQTYSQYQPSDIKEVYWCKIGGKFQLRFVFEGGNHIRFDGFRRSVRNRLLRMTLFRIMMY